MAHRVGQYTRIEWAFQQSIDLDLTTVNLERLLSIYGVGSKTARLFMLHSRQDCQHVVLDTHILRFLNQRFGLEVPANTPPPKEYARLEPIAANPIRSEFPSLSMAAADLLIWTKMSGRLEE